MAWFLYIMCVLWLVVGLGMILKSQKTVEIMKGLFGETIPRGVSIIPIVIGVLFVLSRGAVKPNWEWFPLLMGILAIVKGLVFLFSDEELSRDVLSWWFGAPPAAIKLWGTMVLILGISLFWAIQ